VEVELPLEEDVAVEAADEEELLFEPDSDSTAANRSCVNSRIACRALWVESVGPLGCVDEVDPVVEAELSRFATTSWRKVVRFGLPADALVVLPDELLPESADTRLLKSDCSVLRVLFVKEVEDVDELLELASNCEISRSSPLEKLE
jgi:hypothetical protein